VRSETASWIYVAGPRVYFAAAVAATTLVPVLYAAAPLEAAGGILLLVGTLALGRFALATAALDTGSPFGGMGASRDMTIAALAEPALMLGLFASALAAGSLSLGVMVRGLLQQGLSFHPSDLLAFAGLFIIVITETGRIPVDNPATHLELTMIHEAMVLEYAGPDLALVEWASALKELLYLTLLVDLFVPAGMATSVAPVALLVALLAWAGKIFILAIFVTIAESTNAKLRLFRVPELVSVSLGLAFLALAIRFL
jgi:formate hydrogenlyase subunit 4